MPKLLHVHDGEDLSCRECQLVDINRRIHNALDVFEIAPELYSRERREETLDIGFCLIRKVAKDLTEFLKEPLAPRKKMDLSQEERQRRRANIQSIHAKRKSKEWSENCVETRNVSQ